MSQGDEGDGAVAGDGHMAGPAPVTEVIYDEAHSRGAVVALRVKGSTREILLTKRRQWSMGARTGCDIVIEDAYVSGQHCLLERRGDELFVLDRGSKNGTYVNGHEVDGAE